MAGKIRRVVGVLLLITALLVTQMPGYESQAAVKSADFQMDGKTLVKYTGTGSSVSVPAGVKKIGEEAFAGNTYLTAISIGSDVKEIGYGAFRDCPYLSKVVMSDSVEIIDDAAFGNDTSLKKISLGKNLRTLGSGVFAGCEKLETIGVSEENPRFLFSGNALYNGDKSRLYCYVSGAEKKSYTMPSTVEKIDPYAFWGNEKLTQIVLSSNLKEIPGYAFSNCKALTGIAIPYSVKNIDAKAFENCSALKTTEIPASVSYIHGSAFDGCPNLKIIAKEGTAAYNYYENWKALHPKEDSSSTGGTVTESDGKIYIVGGNGEVTVVDKDKNPGTSSSLHDPSNVDYVPETDPLLEEEGGEVIGKTMVVGQQAVVLLDGSRGRVVSGLENRNVTEDEEAEANSVRKAEGKGGSLPKFAVVGDKIASFAYYGEQRLTSYKIPSGVKEIGSFAFARSGLTGITIPEGVEAIGYASFYHCDNLSEVSIPKSVKHIGASAFSYTKWFSDWGSRQDNGDFLIVGDGVLLAYKGNEASLKLPEEVKVIAPSCFAEHGELKTLVLPDTVTEIGEEAFLNCSGLQEVTFGKGILRIGDRAFKGTALTKVTLPPNVENIGIGAFDVSATSEEKLVTFQGGKLPKLSVSERSATLGRNERKAAFPDYWTAVVPYDNMTTKGTVLEEGKLGLEGEISVIKNGELKFLERRKLPRIDSEGIRVISKVDGWKGKTIEAGIEGSQESFILYLETGAKEKIENALKRVYGEQLPEREIFSMTLYDMTESIPYEKLGRTPLTVTVPLSVQLKGKTLHGACLDKDGQLEELSVKKVTKEDGEYVQLSTTRVSDVVLYTYGEGGTPPAIGGNDGYTSLSGKKDYSPNTGDNSIHPKWFLAVGMAALGIGCFLYRPSIKKRKNLL